MNIWPARRPGPISADFRLGRRRRRRRSRTEEAREGGRQETLGLHANNFSPGQPGYAPIIISRPLDRPHVRLIQGAQIWLPPALSAHRSTWARNFRFELAPSVQVGAA